MERNAIKDLLSWKQSKGRKPLIIKGARQVGKTWLMKSFGTDAYDDYVYVNFDDNVYMQELFKEDLNPKRIIRGLEVFAGKKIDPENTLIIFDEVQEVPRALSSLKYFYEDAFQYQLICAGSLLGIALHQGTSFPVGKVDFLNLYPMSMDEFFRAAGYVSYSEMLRGGEKGLINTFGEKCRGILKTYMLVGGMPEAVQKYIETDDYRQVKSVQRKILDAYEQDFSKHAPNEIVPRIRMVWNSIPSQLARENNRFLYGALREGGRAREFEAAIMWLEDCGLIHKLNRSTNPALPLKAYQDLRTFKLFLNDIGLLSCMSGVSPEMIFQGNDLFTEFKGALTEQFVMQQLLTIPEIHTGYYSNERSTAEIDFLVDTGNQIIPIEAKATTNLKAKSLKTYIEKFNPQTAVRTSLAGYKQEEHILNLPLFAIGYLIDWL